MLPADAAAVVQLALHQANDNGYSSGHQFALALPQGETWFEISIASRATLENEEPRFLVLSRDITARKVAESALIGSEARLRAIISISPVPMALNDDRQHITYLNPAFTQTFGYTEADIPTLAEWWPKAYPDLEYRQWIIDAWQVELEHAKRTGAAFSPIEVNIQCKDGAIKTVLGSAASFTSSFEGNHLVVLYDITERKQAEKEKAALEAQLQQAQKLESIGRLAGGVAHDFNNMLGVILGNAELALCQVDSTQAIHADLLEIRQAAQRSAELTRQLLAFARKQTVAPQMLKLNEIVDSSLRMLQRLIGEGIQVTWQPEADLWPVKMDPSQVDQILANLCVNARDAIKGVGQIAVATANTKIETEYCVLHAEAVPGEYVRLSVSDSGCGMDQQTLGQIFEPFFTTKEVGSGTGLGLATVYGAVKQNHGFIVVFSQPDHDTRFEVYLPRHEATIEQPQSERAEVTLTAGPKTILLVEDEPAILKLAKKVLEAQRYTVLAACSPGEAIRLAQMHSGGLHLLITDVIMPEMNGRELANVLLTLQPELKCLFTSGYTADVIAHHGVLNAGVSFIQKPFAIHELTATVRQTLEEETL